MSERASASVLQNATANFATQAVVAALVLLSTPVFLRLLGAEALGLTGFFVGLQAVIRILDMGLSAAVVRQMARLGGQPERWDELSEFFTTFERLFSAAALVIAVLTLSLAPFLAAHWLRGEHLSREQIAVAVALIGAQIAVQFVASVYHGVLIGLERQVLYNVIRVMEACVGTIGAILLLVLWAPRVELLFGWTLVVAAVAVAIYRRAARAALPVTRRGRFRFEHVRGVWVFAAGMAGISATGTLLSNMDRLLLSRWLKLESFGHYTLACSAALALSGLLVAPVFNALFPRACDLVERRDEPGQLRLYHVAVQVLLTAVWPAATILWVFARDVLQLWIHEPTAVMAAERALPYLAVGVALNTLMVPAYMLQLSHGWTALGVKLNLVLIAVFAPLLYVLTLRWGLSGAAANFALMQGTYLILGLPLTHRRLLRSALGEVVLRDLLPGLALCLVAASALTAARDAVWGAGAVLRYGAVFASWAALTAGTALVSGRVRAMLWRMVAGWTPQAG